MTSLARFGVCVLLTFCGVACVPLGDLAAYSQGEASHAGAPATSTGLPSRAQMPGNAVGGSEFERTAPGSSELQGNDVTAAFDPEQPSPMLGLAPAVVASENADAAALRGDAGDAAVPAAPPGTVTDTCSGASFSELCWYLGDPGASCNDTCTPHGGYASAATAFVGTRAQGGDPERCNAVLLALGSTRVVRSVERTDGRGVGCHFFGTEDDPWWLSGPDFNPGARLNRARLVCGCTL